MKPITVVMETSPEGEVIREAFTMVHDQVESTETRRESLIKDFETGAYKTRWATPRVEIADAIANRGNKISTQSYLFG